MIKQKGAKMAGAVKDRLELYRDGNTFTVLCNGWELFRTTYMFYSEQDMLRLVRQETRERLGLKPRARIIFE